MKLLKPAPRHHQYALSTSGERVEGLGEALMTSVNTQKTPRHPIWQAAEM
jgi:hypothetical protein